MTPPPAKKPKNSVERGGWKKPAAKGNRHHSSGPFLRSTCLFFKLPPEVRLMIYSDLIRSGYPELLRLCQRIHREAVEIVYRDGIHRVKGYKISCMPVYGGRTADQRNRIGDKVQNVEIYRHVEAFDHLGALHPESKYTEISRKNCWIYLTHDSLLWKPRTEEGLVIMLKVVQDFDNVFLNIHESIRQFYHPNDPRCRKALAEFESRVKTLGSRLEPFVGPSTWHDSPDPMSRYWVFHPRQARQQRALTTKETNEEQN